MPYPNEHAARLRDPADFADGTFRRTNGGTIYGSKKVPETIAIIWGKLKGKSTPDDPPVAQALRFPTKNWTADEARAWLKENDIKPILFEPASKEGDDSMSMVELERRMCLAPEFRIQDTDGARRLVGYAALFNTWSLPLGGFVERIQPGAFARSLKEGADVRALIDHEPTLILGRNKAGTLSLAEDEVGLRATIDLPDTQAARDVAISIKRGDVSQMSFRFATRKDEWHEVENRVERTLIDVDLADVSVVTFPAYPDTSVAVRSLEEWKKAQVPPEPERGTPISVLRLKLETIEHG